MLLQRASVRLFESFHDLLGVSPVDCNLFTIGSLTNYAAQLYLTRNKKYGQRFLNHPMVYSIVRDCAIGGLTQVVRTRSEADKDPLNEHHSSVDANFVKAPVYKFPSNHPLTPDPRTSAANFVRAAAAMTFNDDDDDDAAGQSPLLLAEEERVVRPEREKNYGKTISYHDASKSARARPAAKRNNNMLLLLLLQIRYTPVRVSQIFFFFFFFFSPKIFFLSSSISFLLLPHSPPFLRKGGE